MKKKYKKKKKNIEDYLKENGIKLSNDEKQIVIDGIKTDYTVTINGDVKSYKFINCDKPKVLTPIKLSNGYYAVNIMVGSNEKLIHIHKLVATNFIPNPDNKPQINHKDGDKSHNSVSNLEWVTAKENINHAYAMGLNSGIKGENHHNASMTEEITIEICDLLIENNLTYKQIAEKLGISYSIVKKIKNKERWKHITEQYDFSKYKPAKKIGNIVDMSSTTIESIAIEKYYSEEASRVHLL